MNVSDSIKIAIHHRAESFSGRWIEYCKEKKISYELVNCYDSNIMEHLKSFDVLLWHWSHGSYRDVRAAPPIIKAAEKMGIVVFPSFDTCWTFDNKVAQKYQLESIGSPFVPTYVFYDKEAALEWLSATTFPKVFKLSRGAGSMNVHLVRNYKEGQTLVKRAFSTGFKNSSGQIKENFSKFSSKKTRVNYDWLGKIKRIPKTLKKIGLINKMMGQEIGYVYFQDFIANNQYDTRVTVIGNRAFAFRRMVRNNDFRASGSGMIDYDISKINIECIYRAFEVSRKLHSQSMAFDFVEDLGSTPLIVEISYCYVSSAVKACKGFWDKDLNWHGVQMWPQDAIIEDVIAEVRSS